MSRFYRVLQEAGRTVPDLAEEAGTEEFEAGNPGDDAAGTLDHVEAVESVIPAVPASETHAESQNRPRALPAGEEARNGLGIPARVALDQGSPLIPFALDGAVAEYYGRLRAKIIQEQERKPFRSLVVTSPAPEDGKTVTSLNLALSLGMLPSYRVLLVDGDLRRGRLGNSLGIGDHPGLSNLIEGTAELEDVVLKCDEIPVYFMVRGRAATPPAELLYSPRLIPQLRKMAEHFSMVIVDSPPVNLVADTQLLAAGCDAVLLVARAFATTRKALQKAVQDLSPFRVIGTVLNKGMRADLYRHYKYYK